MFLWGQGGEKSGFFQWWGSFYDYFKLSSGIDSEIEPNLLVFKNRDRHYPICGVVDNVDGVSYLTGPKG